MKNIEDITQYEKKKMRFLRSFNPGIWDYCKLATQFDLLEQDVIEILGEENTALIDEIVQSEASE